MASVSPSELPLEAFHPTVSSATVATTSTIIDMDVSKSSTLSDSPTVWTMNSEKTFNISPTRSSSVASTQSASDDYAPTRGSILSPPMPSMSGGSHTISAAQSAIRAPNYVKNLNMYTSISNSNVYVSTHSVLEPSTILPSTYVTGYISYTPSLTVESSTSHSVIQVGEYLAVESSTNLDTPPNVYSTSTVVSSFTSAVLVGVSSSVVPVWCACTCEQAALITNLTSSNKTTDEVAEEIEALIVEMTVDAKTTRVNERKLVSVEDKRDSAKVIGTLGMSFCIAIVFAILLSDLPILIVVVKNVARTIREKYDNRRLFG